MTRADNIKHNIKQMNFESTPAMRNRILSQASLAMEQNINAPAEKMSLWRIIMDNKIARYATATVFFIAITLSLMIFDKTTQPVYALQDTIEAYNSVRWLHIYESAKVFGEIRKSEIWLGCDGQGNVTNMRFQSDNVGEPIGPLTIAGNFDNSQVWLARHNLHLTGYGNPSVLLRYDVSELDPKFLFERLFEQEKRNEAIVEVNEPMEKGKSIAVTVTYPLGSRSEKWKKVLYIEEDTKLVTRIVKYEWRSQGFEPIKTLEFSNYNKPIDQDIFTLDNDVPANARVVDMTKMEAGLPQGDMTDQEIAEKVTTQFFEAVIDKDFYGAGQLYFAAPDFLIEQAFMGTNVHKIISVGPGYRDPDPDSDSDVMNSSCKVLAEIGGLYYEINAWMIRVIRIDKDTNRWLICGMATDKRPASSIITLSRNRANPDTVIYDGLEPGEFMKKWLILDPIRIEERKYVHAIKPSEKIQKNEFFTDQVNVSNFQANVNISGEDHQWSVLENKYGIIDLTDEFGESSLITYAWAQIEMPQAKQVLLGIGSDDAVKVWLNGQLIHQKWICRGVNVDNDRISATFRKGANQLVIKIQNHGGPWGFCCRLLNEGYGSQDLCEN